MKFSLVGFDQLELTLKKTLIYHKSIYNMKFSSVGFDQLELTLKKTFI